MHPYAVDSKERRNVVFGITLFSIVLTYGFHLLLSRINVEWPWWAEAPSVVGVFGLLYGIFDKWLWRMKLLRKLKVVRIPNLNGIWDAEGVTSFEEEKYKAKVVINQSWTHISITMETELSRSHSLTASILVNQPEGSTLSYEYRNEPKPNAGLTMHAHRGTTVLHLKDENCLEGEYYSGRDRQNYGSLSLKRR